MPIHFTCPHCGATTEAADQYADKTGSCAQCGQTITLPALNGMPPPPDADVAPKRGLGGGWIALIVAVPTIFVLLVCGGMLLALLFPALQAAREAARRAQCTNNMKQIALAMLSYENEYGKFPPAFIPDKNGKPMHSWRVLLLPYLDRQDLYSKYRFDEPWDGPHNGRLASQMPRVYCCPDDPTPGGGMTDYVMVVGPHAFSPGPQGRPIRDFVDGASNTIMLVEVADAGVIWTQPQDLDAKDAKFCHSQRSRAKSAPLGISSYHVHGANVALCDGEVRFISDNIDPTILKNLITIDDGGTIKPTNH